MRKSVHIYFRRENEISLRHVTFFRHAALAENLDANTAKPPAVQGLKGSNSAVIKPALHCLQHFSLQR
jgi:hypothetical protein